MGSARCFVRLWHEKRECCRTGRPILVVTYRLALEAFPGVGNTLCYPLVFYNQHARERVRSVGLFDGQLRLALGPETFLGRWASQVTSSVGDVGLKQLVGLEVQPPPSNHNITVVTVKVAYALCPQQPFRRLNTEWTGRADEWIEQASFLEDYSLGELLPAKDETAAVEILIRFKRRLFRCWALH